MRSLIICEGIDDVNIIGHYLAKTEKWKRVEESELPKPYAPVDIGGNQKFEISKKGDDYLDIWAVGGDTCTDDAFDFLYQMNENNYYHRIPFTRSRFAI